jgi:opacity protein-like surface antigen
MTKTRLAHALVTAAFLAPAGARAQQGYPPPPPAYPPPQYPPPQYAPAPPPGKPFKPGLELVGFAGYHVASNINFYGANFNTGHATIDGSASYGAALRFKVRPGEAGELMWIYVPTNAHVYSTLGNGDSTLTINYFQIGGSKSFRADRLEPYLGATLGAAIFSPGALRVNGVAYSGSDIWRFAFTLGGGLKIWLIEQLAIQLDARMMAPVWFSSATFYSGPAGAFYGVSGGIPVVEGNFTGGIVIAP